MGFIDQRLHFQRTTKLDVHDRGEIEQRFDQRHAASRIDAALAAFGWVTCGE